MVQILQEKGLEVLQFLVKRKQRKLATINKEIAECKVSLEIFKDTPPFESLTSQLNKVLEHKDVEIKQRKKRKYWRDTNDYRLHQTFQWQLKLKEGARGSVSSSPDKEVCIVTPPGDHNLDRPKLEDLVGMIITDPQTLIHMTSLDPIEVSQMSQEPQSPGGKTLV